MIVLWRLALATAVACPAPVALAEDRLIFWRLRRTSPTSIR